MIKAVVEKPEWDLIIKDFENSDIYYHYDYARPFSLHGDGCPVLLYYSNGKGFTAINSVMKREIREINSQMYYDFITPYGYGGWVTQGSYSAEDLDKFVKEYETFCADNYIVSEFVRFHPLLANQKEMENYYDISHLGFTVAIDLLDTSTIEGNIKSKYKNVIRKAIKSGIVIKKSREKYIYDEFIEIYNSTMDRDNADSYYYFENQFYDLIRLCMGENAVIYYAEYNGKIIGASIFLIGERYIHYHLSGAVKDYMPMAPMNLLLYTVACDYAGTKEKLHLGGGVGGSTESNLYRFKKSFNKNGDNEFCIGRKIFNSAIYNDLVSLREEEKNFDKASKFFPLYRS